MLAEGLVAEADREVVGSPCCSWPSVLPPELVCSAAVIRRSFVSLMPLLLPFRRGAAIIAGKNSGKTIRSDKFSFAPRRTPVASKFYANNRKRPANGFKDFSDGRHDQPSVGARLVQQRPCSPISSLLSLSNCPVGFPDGAHILPGRQQGTAPYNAIGSRLIAESR
jgi:hypothetical protein